MEKETKLAGRGEPRRGHHSVNAPLALGPAAGGDVAAANSHLGSSLSARRGGTSKPPLNIMSVSHSQPSLSHSFLHLSVLPSFYFFLMVYQLSI